MSSSTSIFLISPLKSVSVICVSVASVTIPKIPRFSTSLSSATLEAILLLSSSICCCVIEFVGVADLLWEKVGWLKQSE